MPTKKIVIANWKMKLMLAETLELAGKMKEKFRDFNESEVVVCPNFMSLLGVKEALSKSPIKIGAQDVYWEERGAYTGEISSSMLTEAGCQYVIVGHSERRKYLHENYEMIHQKVKAVLNAGGLIPVVCLGEEAHERGTDKRDLVLVDQLYQALAGINVMGDQQVIIAYEPIWAIGSGFAIEPSEAEYAHKIIKLTLNDMFGVRVVKENFRIIYGGSISSKNVKEFANLEGVDGLLVGGASLEAEEFYKISKEILK